ncbi:hypothetical protein BZA70DRAFT_274238 [Myxozyma melibiosi]|uniref:STEEP1 domain-containing protein n=1 Tax=Myxozyma melibiosi TaxID=54550 RepID=A0ABR1FFI1_9ASCO
MSSPESDTTAAYSCRCAQFVVAVAPSVGHLPRRQADLSGLESIIVAKDKCELVIKGDRDAYSTNLKREDGTEEQWFIYRCPRCNLPFAYDLAKSDAPYTYLLESALNKIS